MATAPFAALRKPHDLAATLSPAGAAGNDRLSASLRSFPLFSIPSRTVLYLLPFRILLLLVLLLREPGHSSANLFRVCVLLISVAARYTGYVAFVVVLAAGHFIVVALGATQLRPDAVSLARYSPSLPTASLVAIMRDPSFFFRSFDEVVSSRGDFVVGGTPMYYSYVCTRARVKLIHELVYTHECD